jgi:predicted ATPase with chaperone activity
MGTGEALEVTKVHSAAGLALPAGGLVTRRPLRAPHHGASAVAMVGGGSSSLRPGEISLAVASEFQCPLPRTVYSVNITSDGKAVDGR